MELNPQYRAISLQFENQTQRSRTSVTVTEVINDEECKKIGEVFSIYYYDEPPEIQELNQPYNHKSLLYVQLGAIRLDPEYIGKGFGLATYVNLINRLSDVPLISERIHENVPSEKVWEKLVVLGFARKVRYIDEKGIDWTRAFVSIPSSKRGDPESSSYMEEAEFDLLIQSSNK